MGTRAAWLGSLVMLLALTDSGQTQPGADAKHEPANVVGAELVAINGCVREVRRARPGSDFDAHVGTQGAMRYLGTDAEIAEFKRCMEMRGFPVDPR